MIPFPREMRASALALLLLATAGCTGDDAPAGSAATAGSAAGSAAGRVEVRTVRDDSTGAELPRVALAGRGEVEARVNTALDSLARSLRCDPETQAPGAPASTFETRTSVTHAADDVLSVSVHASYYCGGPYPTNDANLSVTYDLATGAAVPFEALFLDYDADRVAITGVLQTSLQPAASDMEDCDDLFTAEALAATTFDYTISPAGLDVQPAFPHVIEACAVTATVPLASLRAFAPDGGVLARVADAAAQ